MALVVVFDANVLYPYGLCDLLLTTLQSGLYRAHWSTSILGEVERTFIRNFPDRSREKIQRRIQRMNDAQSDALVEPPAELIQAMTNDPKDKHVLATAVAAEAEVLVTFNLDHFPESACHRYGVEPQHPDDFVEHLVELDPAAIWRSLIRMAGRRKNPPATPEDIRTHLAEKHLPKSMALLADIRGM